MTVDPGEMQPHFQPVAILVNRAAKALHADTIKHIRDATPFVRLHPDLQQEWRRRARLTLIAAFPSLVVAGDQS